MMMNNFAKMSRKRVSLSLEEKVTIIRQACIEKQPQSLLAQQYGVSPGTISRVIKDQQKYTSVYAEGKVSCKKQKLRQCNYKELEECMIDWVSEMREKNSSLRGRMILQKAVEYAKLLKIDTFKASQGWLSKFKERHGLTKKALSIAAISPVKLESDNCLPSTSAAVGIQDCYDANDIYQCVMTTLFYDLTPDRTTCFRNKCFGRIARSNRRLLVLLCTNLSGTDKRRLLLVGKNKNPQCFKHIKESPVDYTWHRQLQMSSATFEQWLKNFDSEMREEDRNVLLLSESFPCVGSLKITNCRLEFLSPEKMPLLQSINTTIGREFKLLYRSRVMKRYLVALDAKQDGKFAINLADAIDIASAAWTDVTPSRIVHSLQMAEAGEAYSEDSNQGALMDETIKIWSNIAAYSNADIPFEAYLNIDNELATSEQQEDGEMIGEEQYANATDSSCDTDDDELGEEQEQEPPTAWDALAALRQLRAFSHGNIGGLLDAELNSIENAITNITVLRMHQNTITTSYSGNTTSELSDEKLDMPRENASYSFTQPRVNVHEHIE